MKLVNTSPILVFGIFFHVTLSNSVSIINPFTISKHENSLSERKSIPDEVILNNPEIRFKRTAKPHEIKGLNVKPHQKLSIDLKTRIDSLSTTTETTQTNNAGTDQKIKVNKRLAQSKPFVPRESGAAKSKKPIRAKRFSLPKKTPIIKRNSQDIISTVSSSSFKSSSSNSTSKVTEKKISTTDDQKKNVGTLTKTSEVNQENSHSFENNTRTETKNKNEETNASTEQSDVTPIPPNQDFTVLDYTEAPTSQNDDPSSADKNQNVAGQVDAQSSVNITLSEDTRSEVDEPEMLTAGSKKMSSVESSLEDTGIETVNEPLLRKVPDPKPPCPDIIYNITTRFNKLRKQMHDFSRDISNLNNSTCLDKNCCADRSAAMAQLKEVSNSTENNSTTNESKENTHVQLVPYELNQWNLKKKKMVKSISLDDLVMDMTTTEPTTIETTTMNDETESTTLESTTLSTTFATETTTMQDQTESTVITTEPTTLAPTTLNDVDVTTENSLNEVYDFSVETYQSKYGVTTSSPYKSSVSYEAPSTKNQVKVVCSYEYIQPIQNGCFVTSENDITPTGPDGTIKNPFNNEKAMKFPFLQRNQQRVCCYTSNDAFAPQTPYAYPVPYMPYLTMYNSPPYSGFYPQYPQMNPYNMFQPFPVQQPQPLPLPMPCNFPTGLEAKSTNSPDDIIISLPTPNKEMRLLNSTEPKQAGVTCGDDEFACDNGLQCVDQTAFCDSKVQCSDSSDEAQCSCRSYVGPAKVCDGIFDCPKGEDELGCFDCPENSFSCDNWDRRKSQATCVPFEKRCDFTADCNTGKDELECSVLTDSVVEHRDSYISYGDGYLHHNFKGKWYPVCYSTVQSMISSWALEVCQTEIDPEIEMVQVGQRKQDTLYDGFYIQESAEGLTLVASCEYFQTVAYVQCPKPSCGSRLENKSVLDKSQERMTRDTVLDENILQAISSQLQGVPMDYRNFGEEYVPISSSYPSEDSYSNQYYQRSMQEDLSWRLRNSPLYPNLVNSNNVPVYEQEQLELRFPGPSRYVHAHPPGINEENCPLCRNSRQTELEFDYPYENENSQMGFRAKRQIGNENIDLVSQDERMEQLNEFGNMHISPDDQVYIRTKRDVDARNVFEKPSDSATGRVVGGKKSQLGSWPWLIALYMDGYFHCGGVILEENWVMTAAHCVDGFQNHYFEVYAGMLRRFSFSPSEQVRTVSRIVMHSMFKRVEMINDLALLRLNAPLRYNRYVRPICLPDITENPDPFSICTAVGWGALFEHGPDPDHMREVQVPILPMCKHYEDRVGEVICAGMPQGGRDTCQGDSGGPLLCRIPTDLQRWYVSGVVSHGEGCARPNEPGVYTRVSQFLPWLLSQSDLSKIQVGAKRPLQICPGMMCSNRCIPLKRKCDGIVDCLNAEDELGCNGVFYRDADENEEVSSGNFTFEKSLSSYPSRVSFIDNNDDLEDSTTTTTFPTTTDQTTLMDITTTDQPETTSTTLADETTIITSTMLPETTITPLTTPSSIQQSQLTNSRLDLVRSIRSYQIPSLTSQRFSCSKIPQVIPSSRRCDGIIDCEDGTDEKDCLCKDILINSGQTSLLCNNIVDCADQSDEMYCSDCMDDVEFDCRKSRMCIPSELRCDGVPDCPMSEDETDCLILVNNQTIEMDNANRPKLLRQGVITVNQKGTWSSKCYRSTDDVDALEACTALGFTGFKTFDPVSVKKKSLRTPCNGLKVECSGFKDMNILNKAPWHVDIYLEGELKCAGILLTPSTVVTAENCLLGVDLKAQYVTALVGRSSNSERITGPYEQSARVDSLNGAVLHLNTPIELSYEAVPVMIPSWFPKASPDDTCLVTKYDKNNFPMNIELTPELNCEDDKRCFKLKDDSVNVCSDISLERLMSGGVMCNSSIGWYVAALYSDYNDQELNDFCSNKVFTLASAETSVTNEVLAKLTDVPPIEDTSCAGIRCGRGQCVPTNNMCDGVAHCPDGLDESADVCAQGNYIGESDKCQVHELQCSNKKCIPKTSFCDNKNDCGDGSDEPKDCATKCASYLRLSHPERICDGKRNCFDKSDEMNCQKPCEIFTFKCARSTNTTNTCISDELVCDGKPDCIDQSDEKNCYSLAGDENGSKKKNKGILMKNTFGKWHTECFDANTVTPIVLNDRCRQLGFRLAKSREFIPTTERPKLDTFSIVKLRRGMKITLRGDRPIIEEKKGVTCTGIILECVS